MLYVYKLSSIFRLYFCRVSDATFGVSDFSDDRSIRFGSGNPDRESANQ